MPASLSLDGLCAETLSEVQGNTGIRAGTMD
jgi:hypothetical protein